MPSWNKHILRLTFLHHSLFRNSSMLVRSGPVKSVFCRFQNNNRRVKSVTSSTRTRNKRLLYACFLSLFLIQVENFYFQLQSLIKLQSIQMTGHTVLVTLVLLVIYQNSDQLVMSNHYNNVVFTWNLTTNMFLHFFLLTVSKFDQHPVWDLNRHSPCFNLLHPADRPATSADITACRVKILIPYETRKPGHVRVPRRG